MVTTSSCSPGTFWAGLKDWLVKQFLPFGAFCLLLVGGVAGCMALVYIFTSVLPEYLRFDFAMGGLLVVMLVTLKLCGVKILDILALTVICLVILLAMAVVMYYFFTVLDAFFGLGAYQTWELVLLNVPLVALGIAGAIRFGERMCENGAKLKVNTGDSHVEN